MEILGTLVLVLLLVGLIMLGLAASGRERRERQLHVARLATIERKLDAVLDHLDITLPEPERPAIVRLLQEDKRIEAIKVYREETGASLLDAKNAVDAIATRYGYR